MSPNGGIPGESEEMYINYGNHKTNKGLGVCFKKYVFNWEILTVYRSLGMINIYLMYENL